jgi:hypothetical protein
MYTDLGEGRVDPVVAEVGVLLEAADRLHGLQGHLPHARRPPVGFVLQSLRSFLSPPPQDPVDGGGADPEVAGDRLRAPTVRVQRHHGRPGVPALGALVVGWEASHKPQRDGLLGEDALDRLAGRKRPKRT